MANVEDLWLEGCGVYMNSKICQLCLVMFHFTGKLIVRLLLALSLRLAPLESEVLVLAAPSLLNHDQLACRSSSFSDSPFISTREEVLPQDVEVNIEGRELHKETPVLFDGSSDLFPGCGERLCDDAQGRISAEQPPQRYSRTSKSSEVSEALNEIEKVLMSDDHMDHVAMEDLFSQHMPLMTSVPEQGPLQFSPWNLIPSIPEDAHDYHLAESQLGPTNQIPWSPDFGNIGCQGENTFEASGTSIHHLYPLENHYQYRSFPETLMKPTLDTCSQFCDLTRKTEFQKNGWNQVHSCHIGESMDGMINLIPDIQTSQESRSLGRNHSCTHLSGGSSSSPGSVDPPASISSLGWWNAEPSSVQNMLAQSAFCKKQRSGMHPQENELEKNKSENTDHQLILERKNCKQKLSQVKKLPLGADIPQHERILQDPIYQELSSHNANWVSQDTQASFSNTDAWSQGGLTLKEVRNEFNKNGNGNFSLDNVDSKALAWIGSLPRDLKHPEYEEMKSTKLQSIQVIDQTEKTGDEKTFLEGEFSSNESSSYIQKLGFLEEFLEQLWCLNGYFLERLEISRSDSRYIQEQTELQQWVREEVLLSLDQTLRNTGTLCSTHEIPNLNIGHVQKVISRMLHHRCNGNIWKIKLNHLSEIVSVYKYSWILTNEAATKSICLYYKSINHQKWDSIFPSEFYFFLFMTRIKSFYYLTKSSKLRKINHNFSPILPWKDQHQPFQDLSPYCFLSYRINYFDKDMEYLKENVNEVHLETNEDHQSSIVGAIKAFGQDIYNTHPGEDQVSLYKWIYPGRTILRNPHREDHDSTMRITRERLKVELNNLDIFTKFSEPIFTICRSVWLLNYEILETFGCEPRSEKFKKEQNSLQQWLMNVTLSSLKEMGFEFMTERGNGIKSSMEIDLVHSIRQLFESEETMSVFPKESKIKKGDKLDLGRIGQSMGKMVVQAVETYYKNENPIKWNDLSLNGGRFLNLLLHIQRQFIMSNKGAYVQRQMKALEGLEVLPWKEKTFPDSKQCHDRLKIALYFCFTKEESKSLGLQRLTSRGKRKSRFQ